MEPRRASGSSKVTLSLNGNHLPRSYGFTGNVRLVIWRQRETDLPVVVGCGKTVLWYVGIRVVFVKGLHI